MNKTAYIVLYLNRTGQCVRLGVFSEPSPTITGGGAVITVIYAEIEDDSFQEAYNEACVVVARLLDICPAYRQFVDERVLARIAGDE